jgi:hypothetical protein
MKTTVDIPDSLLAEARLLAAEERTSVKALIQEGLQRVLDLRAKRKCQFELRRASVSGQGLQQQMAEASWQQISEAAYEGRGS